MPRLPEMEGRPIRLEIRRDFTDRRGPVHAGSFLRERRIVFDRDTAENQREFARILVHELFHFAWIRLGNSTRRSFEDLLRGEIDRRARGELGWSAEWRKQALAADDPRKRTRRWREYVCESFCDTAAWIYGAGGKHAEFTLATRYRQRRRRWFGEMIGSKRISI